MRHLKSRSLMGFTSAPIHKLNEPHPFHYLAQRTSFWIAVISLMAFVTGNMIGQHGWQVFLRSVMGRDDDSLIVYTGTVSPVAKVPDYSKWSTYGGNAQLHTFREVPENALLPFPAYAKKSDTLSTVVSVDFLGSYSTGEPGSGGHPAVDIRLPVGTPVLSMANGVVSEVKDGGGFGKVIVIRHPNVPDPDHPSRTTTLFSSYAHLSAFFVSEGTTVEKGERIGLSGDTGDASGPHLHFQIDRDSAPFHPYWPFGYDELRAAKLSQNQAINTGFHKERSLLYTVNPLLYVQANYSPVLVVQDGKSESSRSQMRSSTSPVSLISRAELRKATRVARLKTIDTLADARSSSSSSSISMSPTVESREIVVLAETPPPTASTPQNVAKVEISHDGIYTDRAWERVRITLLDAEGNVVTSPVLMKDLVLRAAFGSADFEPQTLSTLDFRNGMAEVSVLPHERRTVVIQVWPYSDVSSPLRYEKN